MKLNLPNSAVTSYNVLFTEIYKGDVEASKLAMSLLHVIHTWDDLIDGDTEVSTDDVNCAFLFALTDISSSPLWTAELAGATKVSYYSWQAANELEANKDSSDNDLAKAWMLRARVYDIFILIAERLYGREWAEHISSQVYAWYGETLEQFILEIRDA